jgi:outer membrane lipoprotein
VISKNLRRQAEPIRGFEEVRDNPGVFKGKTVILGGEIVETRVAPDRTTLVVLERRLDAWEEPKGDDPSDGRFMVRASHFLDPIVYAPGRKVTVAGTVVGVETEPVGQAPYRYVVLQGEQVYLWPVREYAYRPYPYDPFFDPFPFFPRPFLHARRQ